MLESVDFKVGEKKKVAICVQSVNQAPFEVTDAKFELISGEEVESSGECTIDPIQRGSVHLTALIRPLRGGTIYNLVFTYSIGLEEFKHYVKIRVT